MSQTTTAGLGWFDERPQPSPRGNPWPAPDYGSSAQSLWNVLFGDVIWQEPRPWSDAEIKDRLSKLDADLDRARSARA